MAGTQPPEDSTVTPRWLWDLAQAGDTRAMVCVGDEAYYGRLRGQTAAEAERWYRRAAERGDPEAMVRMAQLRWDNPTDPRRAEQASHWYRGAAEAGHVGAMLRLAGMLGDREEKLRWLRAAAEEGSAHAAERLGDELADADRPPEAERWYRQVLPDAGSRVLIKLAGVVARQGRLAEAEELLLGLAEAGAASAMELLDEVLTRQGRHEQARAWRTRAERIRTLQRAAVLEWPASYPAARMTEVIVATAVVTMAVAPFVQTLVTKAAEDTYSAVRALLRRLFATNRSTAAPTHVRNHLLVVRDPDPRLQLDLVVFTDPPNRALQRLKDLQLDGVVEPSTGGEQVTTHVLYWNQTTDSWQILDR